MVEHLVFFLQLWNRSYVKTEYHELLIYNFSKFVQVLQIFQIFSNFWNFSSFWHSQMFGILEFVYKTWSSMKAWIHFRFSKVTFNTTKK